MITKKQYATLSEFRFRLAQFLRFSQSAALDAGMSPLQYLLLLHLRGFAGREWATVGELATRLDASHQGTVGLVKRCEAKGLVTKQRSAEDARRVEIHLTPQGRALVKRIATRHLRELKRHDEILRTVGAAYRDRLNLAQEQTP
ncbi:MAG: Transcriptional regulator, MarR family [Burkholderiaceae bacterium]|nr:MAG: Transcriptional regulator, MarR family [Burkholderiaceae bacterium]